MSCCIATMWSISTRKCIISLRSTSPLLSWSMHSKTVSKHFLQALLVTWDGMPRRSRRRSLSSGRRFSALSISNLETRPSLFRSTAAKISVSSCFLSSRAWACAASMRISSVRALFRFARRFACTSTRRLMNSMNSGNSISSFLPKSMALKMRLNRRTAFSAVWPSSQLTLTSGNPHTWCSFSRSSGSRTMAMAISARVSDPSLFLSMVAKRCRRCKKSSSSDLSTLPSRSRSSRANTSSHGAPSSNPTASLKADRRTG
mmetsp:Transcript_47521/g.107719  ORF Transcript_47521/g.107719 Transcript_47521/m.107719 type:complete len:259 (+) Transcript_47521:1159-1935(+)